MAETSKQLTEFRTQVKTLLKVLPSNITIYSDNEIDAGVKDALTTYNKDRPKVKVVDVDGTGSYYYEITDTTFPDFDTDFSEVLQLEYPTPTISSDETPTYLNIDEEWELYKTPTKNYIRFTVRAPATGYSFRVWYTIPRAFSGDPEAVEIQDQDFYAVCWLAAAYLLRPISGHFLKNRAATDLGMQSMDWNGIARECRLLAAEYERRYNEHVGGSAGAPRVAVIDTDYYNVSPITMRMFRGRRSR